MGIGRFFRWLCERYPLILEIMGSEPSISIDNLYFDMNALVHICSHNNSMSPASSDYTEIFTRVSSYVNMIVHLIQPKKLLYIALDGVAPRAKANQQRTRRYRYGKVYEEQKIVSQQLKQQPPFFISHISVATDFSYQLNQYLLYYLTAMVHENPFWRKFKVIFSGNNVPGEGEHKIFAYIRNLRANPDYDGNLSHCIYGNDADLILLSLASRENRIVILREPVQFEELQFSKMCSSEKPEFRLLHAQILKEYFMLEFQKIQVHDVQHIIFDLILIVCLVGNDFIPCLNHAHISDQGLSNLFESYIKYFNESIEDFPYLVDKEGNILWKHFVAFLKYWQTVEEKMIKLSISDEVKMQNIKRKSTKSKLPILKNNTTEQYIKRHYSEFIFEKDERLEELVPRLAKSYVEGLQWILHYYIQGIQSWTWYFSWHCAPFVSDIIKVISNIDFCVEFSLGRPVSPYEQLVSTIPPISKFLTPKVFHCIFEHGSQLKHYFPDTYIEIPLDNRPPWEYVVILPFIDEAVLQKMINKIIKSNQSQLPDVFFEKNKFDDENIIIYDAKFKQTLNPPDGLNFCEVQNCSAYYKKNVSPIFPSLRSSQIESAVYPKSYPSLNKFVIKPLIESGVHIFDRPSFNCSLFLILPELKVCPAKILQIIQSKYLYVGYPFRVLAENMGLLLPDGFLPIFGKMKYDEDGIESVSAVKKNLQKHGIFIRDEQMVYLVKLYDQKVYNKYSCFEIAVAVKRVEKIVNGIPVLQKQGELHLVAFAEPASIKVDVDKKINVNDHVICINPKDNHGIFGQVQEISEIDSHITILVNPDLYSYPHSFKNIIQMENQKWYTVAELLRLDILNSAELIILRSVQVKSDAGETHEIGLNFFRYASKTLLVLPGYSRSDSNISKNDLGLLFISKEGVDIIKLYRKHYPEVFMAIRNSKYHSDSNTVKLNAQTMFKAAKQNANILQTLVLWHRSIICTKTKLVRTPYLAASDTKIKTITETIDTHLRDSIYEKQYYSDKIFHFQPLKQFLIEKNSQEGSQKLHLGQRVMYLSEIHHGSVPLMATISGFYTFFNERSMIEIILDKAMLGASSLNGRCDLMRGLLVVEENLIGLSENLQLKNLFTKNDSIQTVHESSFDNDQNKLRVNAFDNTNINSHSSVKANYAKRMESQSNLEEKASLKPSLNKSMRECTAQIIKAANLIVLKGEPDF